MRETPTFRNKYLFYDEVTNDNLVLEFYYHNRSHTWYSTTAIGFDIETTNVLETKTAYCYIQQTTVNNVTIVTRKWEECIELWQRINDINHLGIYDSKRTKSRHHSAKQKRRALCFIHNLSFEWSFIKTRFPIALDKDGNPCVFLTEERKPLHVTFFDGIDVYDSMRITNSNLKLMAKTYCKTQKMVGDLDYSKQRNYLTPLTDLEIEYCVNDAQICHEYGNYYIKTFVLTNNRLPMTSTGIVRNATKDRIPKSVFREIKKCVNEMQFEAQLYKLAERWLFRGGYTHANARYCDEIVTKETRGYNIVCYDFKSSYPGVMCGCGGSYYPSGKFKEWENITQERFKTALKNECVIFVARFRNIKQKYDHSLESKNKCMELVNPSMDNGRVAFADLMTVFITEIDYLNYCDLYEWDSMEVLNVWSTGRDDLPFYLIDSVCDYFSKKEELGKKLKTLDENTDEWRDTNLLRNISKANLNALYGMCVQKPSMDECSFNTETCTVETIPNAREYEKAIESSIFIYSHGIYVTAWARRNLIKTLAEIERVNNGNGGVLYCDTDSIYMLEKPNNLKVIETYNENVRRELKEFKIRNNIDETALPHIGEFDIDGHYIKGKFLGAKRYIVTDDHHTKVTIAGLPKDVLHKISARENVDIYDLFSSDGMIILPEDSGKLTTSYTDEQTTAIIDGVEMSENSCVCLYEIPFNMTLEQYFIKLILSLKGEDYLCY